MFLPVGSAAPTRRLLSFPNLTWIHICRAPSSVLPCRRIFGGTSIILGRFVDPCWYSVFSVANCWSSVSGLLVYGRGVSGCLLVAVAGQLLLVVTLRFWLVCSLDSAQHTLLGPVLLRCGRRSLLTGPMVYFLRLAPIFE